MFPKSLTVFFFLLCVCFCRAGNDVRKASMCLWKSWGPLRGSCPCRCLSITRSCTQNKSDARWDKTSTFDTQKWSFLYSNNYLASCLLAFKCPERKTCLSVAHFISLREKQINRQISRRKKQLSICTWMTFLFSVYPIFFCKSFLYLHFLIMFKKIWFFKCNFILVF